MKRNNILLFSGIIILLLAIGLVTYFASTKKNITSFEECAAAGYPIQESFPERCVSPDGKAFTKKASQQPITIEGFSVCLLHKDQNSPHTLECAIGLKASDGLYYSLRDETSDKAISRIAGSDQKMKITGSFLKEASDRYQSEGTITVNAVEFLE